MFDHDLHLISAFLAEVATRLAADPSDVGPWIDAVNALAPTRADEPELAQLLESRDAAALAALVAEWRSGKKHLPLQDREVLKRALKAFRKSLKVTQLAAESSLGGGPMSSGRVSSIVGMRPPDRYPRTVWDELARQKRLVDSGRGQFELPPGER